MSSEQNQEQDSIEIKTRGVEEGYIILPYNEEQFKSFINSLLGSPQALGKVFLKPFELDAEDIRNLHTLVQQRITQQNNGVLAKFIAKLVYTDNSTVEFNSITDIVTYNEIRPVISGALHLSWDYIIQFPDKNAPEKQRIQVSFVTSDTIVNVDSNMFEYASTYTDHLISYRVEHTARTWGADIAALLEDYIVSLIKPVPRIKSVIRENLERIATSAGVCIALITMISLIFADARIAQERVAAARAEFTELGDTITDLNVKVEHILNRIISGPIDQSDPARFLLSVGLPIGLGFLTYLLITATDNYEPSFILLTKESVKEKERVEAKLQRKWFSFVLSVFLSITLGVFSNFVYTWVLELLSSR